MLKRIIKSIIMGVIMVPLMGLIFFGTISLALLDSYPLEFYFERMTHMDFYQARAYILSIVIIGALTFFSLDKKD